MVRRTLINIGQTLRGIGRAVRARPRIVWGVTAAVAVFNLVAPVLINVIWQSLFSKHAPLDAIEMLQVHLDLIFGERRTT